MNVYYVKYDTTTGQIFSSGNTQATAIEGRDGFMIVDGPVDNTLYKVENQQIVPLPPSPGSDYVYNFTTNQWEINLPLVTGQVLQQRSDLLYASDWTQIPNGPLTPTQQTAWATYRQELRDITSQPGYPTNVVWPTPPA
jgi:hypothetical protein